MDFAPYQDAEPELERARSPPRAGPSSGAAQGQGRRQLSRSPQPAYGSPPTRASLSASDATALPGSTGFGGPDPTERATGRAGIDLFETSLPLRLDYEAMLAYLLLPPAGGVFLLVFEHKSDYVRFHAWQSSLVFSAIFVLHLLFSWVQWLSWLLFAGDLLLIAFLTYHAYRDADTLDRFEIPFFGRIASGFVDNE